METTSNAKAAQDTAALLGFLDTRDDVAGRRVGAGFCIGGGMAIVAAGSHPERFAAVASFHGGNLANDAPDTPHRFASKLEARLYIAAATDYPSYPPEMARRLETALREEDVLFEAEPVLVALRDGEASTQRDLARFARIEQPPIAQTLARMERDGLICRTPDPADGRSQRIELTDKALSRLPEAIAALCQGNRDALGGFTDTETDQFVAFLTWLLDNLDRLAIGGPG